MNDRTLSQTLVARALSSIEPALVNLSTEDFALLLDAVGDVTSDATRSEVGRLVAAQLLCEFLRDQLAAALACRQAIEAAANGAMH
jgi:hypothetical protein